MDTKERYEKIVSDPKYSNIFKDYYYYDRNVELSKEETKSEALNHKSRNKSVIGGSNLTDYVNPHTIYTILEEKEKKAFTFRDEEKVNHKLCYLIIQIKRMDIAGIEQSVLILKSL